MPLRTCTVSYKDPEGIRHSVEVPADSLYETAALGLRVFHAAEFLEPPTAPGTALEICVRDAVVVVHEVRIGKLRNWLFGGGARSPAQMILKERLRSGLPWLKPEDVNERR